MKICPNCGHENNDTGKFCEECGTKLVEAPKFCPECGTKLEGTTKFCPECGCNLATGVAPQEYDSEIESYDSDSNDLVEYEDSSELYVPEEDENYEEYVDEDEYVDEETTEEKIKKIVDKYRKDINKDGTGYSLEAINNPEYSQVIQNILYVFMKDTKKEIKKSELLSFIDTTIIGKGKNGLLFTTTGIYHKQAGFKGFFIPYSIMYNLVIEGSSLTFKGTAGTGIFSLDYSIIDVYNLPALKECLDEIYVIL